MYVAQTETTQDRCQEHGSNTTERKKTHVAQRILKKKNLTFFINFAQSTSPSFLRLPLPLSPEDLVGQVRRVPRVDLRCQHAFADHIAAVCILPGLRLQCRKRRQRPRQTVVLASYKS